MDGNKSIESSWILIRFDGIKWDSGMNQDP